MLENGEDGALLSGEHTALVLVLGIVLVEEEAVELQGELVKRSKMSKNCRVAFNTLSTCVGLGGLALSVERVRLWRVIAGGPVSIQFNNLDSFELRSESSCTESPLLSLRRLFVSVLKPLLPLELPSGPRACLGLSRLEKVFCFSPLSLPLTHRLCGVDAVRGESLDDGERLGRGEVKIEAGMSSCSPPLSLEVALPSNGITRSSVNTGEIIENREETEADMSPCAPALSPEAALSSNGGNGKTRSLVNMRSNIFVFSL